MKYLLQCYLLMSLTLSGPTPAADTQPYTQQRMELMRLIEQDVRETSVYLDREMLDARVMKALAEVPRHLFVPDPQRRYAYQNRPLPIGHGQTISQPFIVALMTQTLFNEPRSRILEVGTGSGYQTAILAELCERVYTVELVRELNRAATELLGELGQRFAPAVSVVGGIEDDVRVAIAFGGQHRYLSLGIDT